MHYCLVICQVSSTGHIYHWAAKRRGDKFDRSMTRGKLLDNDTKLFIFMSILIMTQLHPRDPENRHQNRFSERRFSKKSSYNLLNGKAWLGLLPVRIYREILYDALKKYCVIMLNFYSFIKVVLKGGPGLLPQKKTLYGNRYNFGLF